MRELSLLALLVSSVLACGGGGGTAENAETTATATAAASNQATTATATAAAGPEVPSTCEQKGTLCLPPAEFVKRLCNNVNPDIALAYFRKGTPFTRAYLRGDTAAWNASGGASSEDKLVFDEEVIVLLERRNNTGIEVSGASSNFDVLRWNGSCASLSAEEISFTTPPKPKNAHIEWKYLSDETQNALLSDAGLAKANKDRRDECKGASMGTVSKKCVTLVDKQSDAIAAFIRNGGEVPLPTKVKP
ncbi:MAG: hypothetical protein U0271_17690 [Polyangiaceae bacterium]